MGETILRRPQLEEKDNIINGTWRIGVRSCKLDSAGSRWPTAGSCEYGNKHSGCIRCDQFLGSQAANKDPPQWKYLVCSLRIFEVSCSLVNMYQHFSGSCCLQLQFRRVYPEASRCTRLYVVTSQKTAILIRLGKIHSAQWLVAVWTAEEMLHTHRSFSVLTHARIVGKEAGAWGSLFASIRCWDQKFFELYLNFPICIQSVMMRSGFFLFFKDL
jgi:hypothetical protein